MANEIYAKYIGEGAFVNGVPARDLSKAEWDALTAEQRTAATPLYQVTTERPREKRVAQEN